MRASWGRFSMRSAALIAAALFLAILAIAPREASALDALKLTGEEERLEITGHATVMDGQGDNLRVNTAPGLDGVVRQMSVRASTAGSNPIWMVFALRNVSDKPITRWITAQKYHLIGSRIMWPDLDAPRIEALTPSVGFLPQRVQNEFADIYRVTLNPGQTITYVAELASGRARIFIWEPHAYELQTLDRQLFNGIMLGVVGVLVIFLTAIFAANHRAIFPSAALVAWCALAYLCVDFGFWHKLLQLRAEDTAVYRAATEAALAASLAIFLHIFLRLGSWHGFFRMLSGVWIIAQLSLVFVAVLDPRLASTFARLSFAAIGAVGALLTLFLALRGQDRALALIPTWMLYLVWVFGAAVTLMGELNGDIVVSFLVSGLTIIVTLLGFTVTQFAFSASPAHAAAMPSEQNLRALAVDGAGAAVWEWHARRDEVKVSPVVELSLGYNHGELSTKVESFLQHLHPSDQERLRVQLASIAERNGGMLHTDFRIRHADNSYRWFELEASSISTADQRAVRCVGLLRDVTDQKRAQTRLLHDAVHDSLTGLPNRELFLDRLGVTMAQAVTGRAGRPALILIDLDKFKSVNASFGLIVGDSLLLTVARRLSRHLGPQDTLGRVGGDQFAILLPDAQEADALGKMAEQARRSLRAPVRIAGQDIVLTAAVGIAVHDGQTREGADLLMDAEVAMYHAKGHGADHITVFRPEMRKQRDNRIQIESDLRRALERRQLKVLYQPIIHLPTEELAGFEALVRWEHPQLGLLNPAEFIPVAEESDLIVRLGSYVLLEAVQQAARWQDELPRNDNPVFVSVNVSSRQLFRQDLIQEIRHIIGRSIVPEGVLRLEVTESLVMENPERATEILESLRSAGAGLAMDDFGTGYSSLAYLQRFPFDTIKIDRDLTQAALDDESGAAIVRSIVALANELGKKVVAEGVEIAADVGFLRSIGCDYAQGFYYGEPMNDRSALDLVRIIRKAERKRQRNSYFWAKSESQLDKAKTRTGASEETERTKVEARKKARKAGAVSKAEATEQAPRPTEYVAGHEDAVGVGPALGNPPTRAESEGQATSQYRSPHQQPAPAVAELPLRMPARPGPAPPPPPNNPATARTALPQQPHAPRQSPPTAPSRANETTVSLNRPPPEAQPQLAPRVGVPPGDNAETTGRGRTSPPTAVHQQSSPPRAPGNPKPPAVAAHARSMPPAARPASPAGDPDMDGLSRLSVGDAGKAAGGKPTEPQAPSAHTLELDTAAVVDGPPAAPPKPAVPLPELSTLPPNIASSLAKLAGITFDQQGRPPANDESGAKQPPRKKV